MNNRTYSSEEIMEMNKKHADNIKTFVQPILKNAKAALDLRPTVDKEVDVVSILLTLNALLDIMPAIKNNLFVLAYKHKSAEALALMLLSDAMSEIAVPLVDVVIALDNRNEKANESL